MNTARNTPVEPNVAKMLDPYSNPRTIPGGWDVSAIQKKTHTPAKAEKESIVEPSVAKMLDPYSNPRTIPGGWDVSAISAPENNNVETYGDSSYQSKFTAAPMGNNESAKNTL
jgi:hypothetical protein